MIDHNTPPFARIPANQIINLTRRAFLKVSAASTGSLVLGCHVCAATLAGAAVRKPPLVPVNAWLSISPAEIVIAVANSEMGQGVFTALPMLVAEELDCDWSLVRAEMAPLGPDYVNPMFGGMATGGSTSIRAAFLPLRRAGAAARMMLVAAAAQAWRVRAEDCVAGEGFVSHAASFRRASYGALAPAAARMAVPGEVALRERKAWRVIGRPIPRLDIPAKTDGSAVFGIDVRLPGMLYAAIRQCPVFGGTLAGVDDAAARREPGVIAVVPFKDAVAVVAQTWWCAQSTLAHKVATSWTPGPAAGNDDAAIVKALQDGLTRPATIAADRGDVDGAIKTAARVIEAEYRVPFLAHAAMEPMNCTARVTPDGCEVWAPTQGQGLYARVLPEFLALKPEQIKVNTPFLGGSFGRRFEIDFGIQAALLAKQVGRPVQLIWSREEDMQHDVYRPAAMARVQVALERGGRLTGWRHRVVSPSIMARLFPNAFKDGIDQSAVEGIADQPYAVPALRVEYVRQELGVPVGFWRSVGHGINAFAVESMIDEVAAALGEDPLRLHRDLVAREDRAIGVINQLAALSGWGKPLDPVAGARRGRGMAFHAAFGSLVGEAAEVTVFDDGRLRVDRVFAVIDCGPVVNPDTVDAQLRGAIVFGLNAALVQKIGIAGGRVTTANFDGFPLLTMAGMPEIVVKILDSAGPVGGVGEAGTPPIAPAVTNAIFAATGRRLRSLPISDHDLTRR
ncbi:MAG: molybdopterin-dependent oxidoreductase [Azospirillum sp.]|nr:molybdopterin-dependent oxidoreductase [Azospirillum sp.]